MPKIGVITTFPLKYWDLCAAEMIASFDKFWPKEVELFVSLDKVTPEQQEAVRQNIMQMTQGSGRQFYISNEFDPEHEKFLAETPDDSKETNYAKQPIRFSYKVFALARAAEHVVQDEFDYLIWLDADVITKREITMDDLVKMLPDEKQVASYLGRNDAPHSECGFVAYNMRFKGQSFIERMKQTFTDGSYKKLSGWTDCHVFDDLRIKLAEGEGAFKNLSKGIPGWHVWPMTILGQFMEHRKGQRKVTKTDNKPAPAQQQVAPQQQSLSLDNMDIKTRNCVENDTIKNQVAENTRSIVHWSKLCKPNEEEIVIASAGPSLNRDDLMPFVERGVKIVAVKHAIDRLKSWGIKPWACILLDPRPHVERFVEKPDKDVIYFVASMVAPEVVKTLIDNDCTVIGYNALVGAGEDALFRPGDIAIAGGSATATRGISLLSEVYGFKTFHCFGYDLCYEAMPDMTELNEDGKQKYFQITMTAQTWGGKTAAKTFWTEGQFLAQAKELANLYKTKKDININVYGDGIAGWNYKHWRQFQEWSKKIKAETDAKREKGQDVNGYISSLG